MGVTYNSEQNQFLFDFEHDGQNDIIKLTGSGYDVTAFSHCFYYGYEFSEEIDGALRSAFIKYVKFTDNLKFANERDELLCKTIRQQNVLVIDDIATSGSTLNEVLRSLRILNEDNKITIFSLIGRKDLTIESME